jgi:dipeptidyl aminopeptidase/acylaminoacyl peptidase
MSSALTQAGVPNKLVTIHRGGHGDFDDRATVSAFDQILEFLDNQVPQPAAHNSTPKSK